MICCENIVNVILLKYFFKKIHIKNHYIFQKLSWQTFTSSYFFTSSYLNPSLTSLFYLLTLTGVKSCAKFFLCIDFVKKKKNSM